MRGDVAITGGITPLVKIAHIAEGFGMKCEIHHGGNSLNNVANLHVTMAVHNCEFYEVFPATGANKYGLIKDIEVDENGMVYAPTEPGLGYRIDWDPNGYAPAIAALRHRREGGAVIHGSSTAPSTRPTMG